MRYGSIDVIIEAAVGLMGNTGTVDQNIGVGATTYGI
jgi:hypothetical protein